MAMTRYRAWTAEEEASLRELHQQRQSAAAIAGGVRQERNSGKRADFAPRFAPSRYSPRATASTSDQIGWLLRTDPRGIVGETEAF